MRRVGIVLRLVAVLTLGLVLTGCVAPLVPPLGNSNDQIKRMEVLSQIDLITSQADSNNAVALIIPGESISGYLDGEYYSDYDCYSLEGIARGTSIIATLSGPSSADFDLWIWKDGNWESNWNYTSNETLETTAGTLNYLCVAAWSGKGNYTLKVTIVSGDVSQYGWVIINEAMNWLEVPYKLGGTGRSGIDCSWLVYRVYNNALNPYGACYKYRTVTNIKQASYQIYSPQPGDLILFQCTQTGKSAGACSTPGNWEHVGIYVGRYYIGLDSVTDIVFIHASYRAGKVIVDLLHYSPYYGEGNLEKWFNIQFARYNPDSWSMKCYD